MSEIEAIKIGDRVIWHGEGYSRQVFRGEVVEMTPSGKTAKVKPDGSEHLEEFRLKQSGWRFSKENLEQQAYRIWLNACPRGKFVTTNYNGHTHDGTNVRYLQTSAEMRTAADELVNLAAWYERKPT